MVTKERRLRVGVIAAAGKGTRAWPRTSFIPKPLFTFKKQTILERNVELQFEKFKVETLYILVGHLKEMVIEEVERIRKLYPKKEIHIAHWTGKGLAADVASLRDRIDCDFTLILGDEFYYGTTHEQMLKDWKNHKKAEALIALLPTDFQYDIRKNYSVIQEKGRVRELIEKPVSPPNNLLGLGTYFFTADFFHHYDQTPPSPRSGVIELTEVIDRMARTTGEVYASILRGRYFNINSLADYYNATYLIRSEEFEQYKISLVVPTLNNEATLADVLSDFRSAVDEMVVVDLGSSDSTCTLATGKGVRLMEHEPLSLASGPLHNAPAIYDAMESCKGDIVVLVPADGSFRRRDLPKLLEYLKDSDMAVGTRTTRQLMEQGSNLPSGYRWFNVLFGKLVEVLWWGQEPRYTDIGCVYRAIWRDSFLRIRSELRATNKSYLVEMMIEIMRYHMRCIEVPVSYYSRYGQAYEESFGEKLSYFFAVLKTILTRRFLPGSR